MEQLGEYLLHHVIGEGGMGRVFQAEERLSGRRVAVKMLRREWATIPRVRQLFINEMEILAQLEHPNIVRSLASIEVDDQLAVVLEFVDGASLRELLEDRGALSAEEATHIIACIAKGLAAAHDHVPPFVHRDLKPENIMVTASGTVKVMDFGIAKVLERANQTNTRNVGTLLYMSPEQIDARTIDHRSDLYALGLVFYELLTGRPPFFASSARELFNEQCTKPPPPLSASIRGELPDDIEELLFALLDKDPDRRPQSAQRVIECLGAAAPSTRPPSSRKIGATDPMGPELATSDNPQELRTRLNSSHAKTVVSPTKTQSSHAEPVMSEAKNQSSHAEPVVSEAKNQESGLPDGQYLASRSSEEARLAGFIREPSRRTEKSWHAEDARAEWLGRFAMSAQKARSGDTALGQPNDTVPDPPRTHGQTEPSHTQIQPPMGAAAAAAEDLELSTRTSLLIIGALMLVAGLATYVLRIL